MEDYKNLVRRVQERYGVKKPLCGVDLNEMLAFLDSKLSKTRVYSSLPDTASHMPLAGCVAISRVLNVKRYTVEKYTQVQLWNTQSEYKLKFYKLKFYIHILFIKDEKFGKSLYNHCIKPSCKITSESNERYMTVYECIFDLWQNTNKPSENWLTEIDF